LDVISDGNKLYTIAKTHKEYTEEEPFKSMSEAGPKLQLLGLPNSGLLFQNTLTADPYDSLMEGVTSARYVGTDKVNGVEAHHLKFEQPGLKWELWVAATGKPVVLKAASLGEGDGGKVTTVETYQNWNIDADAAKDAFNFSPDGSKKVKSFTEDE
jgi:hypothetical protein